MKKAFSMIELIFVIVILGALAAVAISKLNATRDDAVITKSAQNLATLIGELASYYTAQSKFNDDINKMTSQRLKDNKYFNIEKYNCLEISVDEYYIVVKNISTDTLCKKFLSLSSTTNILTGRISKTNNNFTNISKSDIVYIPVGGVVGVY
ncbi:type II secretion system protein [Campylobacter sp. MG1]|uniref:type II secretion system protein n=1 Tax=Campylobacter sp. MG1 TaxID=2976332 RepID=UPI00226CA563|nr:type II secretion system protein [Campylobacter sp. MG1]